MTLLELLAWTYADQRAHRYLATDHDWFLFALEGESIVSDPRDRRPVNRDAAAVHAAVVAPIAECAAPEHAFDRRHGRGCEDCARTAGLLVAKALIGERPERITETPIPGPKHPSGLEKRGVYEQPGGRLVYEIKTAEVVTLFEDDWRIDGRRKVRLVGAVKRRFDVEYCPLTWRPSPEFVHLIDSIVDDWERAIVALKRRLRGVAFRQHVVTDLDDDAPPP